MQMTLTEARLVVHQRLSEEKLSEPFFILDDLTTVRESCFVFYWTLQSAHDGGSPVAGNAPCLVDRETGHFYFTGTCFPPEVFIEAFERFGTPDAAFGRLPCTLAITAWREGAQKVNATKRLRGLEGFTLASAKGAIDSVMAGETVSIGDLTFEAATLLAEDLDKLGFVTHLSAVTGEPGIPVK